ncbi:tungstate ABC transporter substrate-binding protein TupA [Campylobacter sputorum]|uniref:tungstate ABC transporter substrate-binding protein TupA n=1 Tax=Campylobacter sputorum TaxID=206 RepID=UPI00053C039A|nr:tungstate ABC transporter substrate-binding protein TupA [Campylobacter sputorum]
MKSKILTFGIAMIMASSLYAKDNNLIMATTTSTDDTGLLDALYPVYKAKTGVDLKWTAVGTGKALEMGKNCDVDVLFVHSPKLEKEFVKNGYGVDRKPVMYNDYVLIGDKSLANKFEGKSLKEAFEIIQNNKIPFFSRGDKSGTHNKELDIWKKSISNVPQKESWYKQTGQGMLTTINVAAEQKGVTLTDRGTFIKYEAQHKGNPPLVLLNEGDNNLKNFYSVINVNPKKCPKADEENAKEFANWITSDEGQKFINDFKLMDKQLFTADAKNRKE